MEVDPCFSGSALVDWGSISLSRILSISGRRTFLEAGTAQTSEWFDVFVEIFAVVIVRELFTGLDASFGKDVDALIANIYLAIGCA